MKLAATVLYVDDVPGTREFYRDAFGIETPYSMPMSSSLAAPGQKYQFAELATDGTALQFATHAVGALMMPGFDRSPTGRPSGVEVAFYTDDVPAAFGRAVGAGAEAVRAPEQMPWGQTVAYVRSKEGTFIGICPPPLGAHP